VSERAWQLSLDAEQDPKIRLLSELVRKVVHGNNEILAGQLASDPFQFTSTLDEDSIETILDDNATSDFYNKLSFEEKKKVTSVLNLSEEAAWRYGSKEYTDGLWDAEGYIAEVPFERRTALVLTGAVGIELVGMNKRLDRLAGAIEPNLFKRSVLLGGVALAIGSERRIQDNEFYRGTNQGGLVSETHIGGTIHGDFWTSRQIRFQHNVVDPIGVEHPFGPAFETILTPAYHSTEARIMSSLLGYAVAFQGVDRMDLLKDLVEDIETVSYKPGGAFGDFGDDDGYGDAAVLDYLIEKGIEEDEILANLIVYPQGKDRLVLTAKKEGVEFMHAAQDYASGVMTPGDSFVVPTHEIKDYIVTLLQSGYGRTSQGALLNVIIALRDRKSNHQPDRFGE
jgi:hypothetical protein